MVTTSPHVELTEGICYVEKGLAGYRECVVDKFRVEVNVVEERNVGEFTKIWGEVNSTAKGADVSPFLPSHFGIISHTLFHPFKSWHTGWSEWVHH